jgi:CrcB protein
MGPYFLIAVGGVLGANARYLVSTWVANRAGVGFPYGTFLINASGSFAIGLFLEVLAGHFGSDPDTTFLFATGFLGAYTTFSTLSYETVALIRQGAIRPAMINALGSAALGVSGAGLGIALGSRL